MGRTASMLHECLEGRVQLAERALELLELLQLLLEPLCQHTQAKHAARLQLHTLKYTGTATRAEPWHRLQSFGGE